MTTIFLSYCSKDRPFTRQLEDHLAKKGVEVWLDQHELLVGDVLVDEIKDAIRRSDYFGVVLSENALTSDWVRLEVEFALGLEREHGGVRVLPILHKPCTIPDNLAGRVWVDFTKEGSFKGGVAALLKRLAKDALLSRIGDVQPWDSTACTLGARFGVLTVKSGRVVFTGAFLANLCEWSLREDSRGKHITNIISGAVLDTTKVVVSDEALARLAHAAQWHVVDAILDVAIDTRVLLVEEDGVVISPAALQDLKELLRTDAMAIDPLVAKDDPRLYILEIYEAVARGVLMMTSPGQLGFHRLIASILFAIHGGGNELVAQLEEWIAEEEARGDDAG